MLAPGPSSSRAAVTSLAPFWTAGPAAATPQALSAAPRPRGSGEPSALAGQAGQDDPTRGWESWRSLRCTTVCHENFFGWWVGIGTLSESSATGPVPPSGRAISVTATLSSRGTPAVARDGQAEQDAEPESQQRVVRDDEHRVVPVPGRDATQGGGAPLRGVRRRLRSRERVRHRIGPEPGHDVRVELTDRAALGDPEPDLAQVVLHLDLETDGQRTGRRGLARPPHRRADDGVDLPGVRPVGEPLGLPHPFRGQVDCSLCARRSGSPVPHGLRVARSSTDHGPTPAARPGLRSAPAPAAPVASASRPPSGTRCARPAGGLRPGAASHHVGAPAQRMVAGSARRRTRSSAGERCPPRNASASARDRPAPRRS